MKILVTGAKGFVGKNLVETLKTIKDGKNRTRPALSIDEIYEYDLDSTETELSEYCKKADFVFNLAGVNRPKDPAEFKTGNAGFSNIVLELLKKHGNKAPVMLSSSVQATMQGRFAGSVYGESKKQAEDIFFEYGRETGVKVFVYRFPNLFGKWCRPNYNSAVATFCNNIANGLEITVNDRNAELELLYIDDLLEAMLDALEDKTEFTEEGFAIAKGSHKVTLGQIVDLLYDFNGKICENGAIELVELPNNSFEKKLYTTFLTYLPESRYKTELVMNRDDRGSFTEMFKTENFGQFSVNITKPGVVKGEHWHHTKWEYFAVVAGEGIIRERLVGSDKVVEFPVSGDKIEAIRMIPGSTHNIENTSKTQDLITVMWANEKFDKTKPDTFFEKVEK